MRPEVEKYLREQGWVFAGVSQPDHKRQWAQVEDGKTKRVVLESELEDLALNIVSPDPREEKRYAVPYIDADRLKKFLAERYKVCPISDDERHGRHCAIIEVENFIGSLQQEQPEVGLENEYKTWWNSIAGKINVEHMMEWYMHETARHFFSLGLNVIKSTLLEWARENYLDESASAIRKICYKQLVDKLNLM